MPRKGDDMQDGGVDVEVAEWRDLLRPMLNAGRVTQAGVAERLSELAGRPVEQSTVSRWLDGTNPRHKHLRAALQHMRDEVRAGAWPGASHDEVGVVGGGVVGMIEEEMRLEREAAARRARALEDLAAAERIYAEATKIRAEVLAAHSRISEKDSDRAREARSPERLLLELNNLPAPIYAQVMAGFLDRLREQESAAAAKGEGTGESRERAG